MTYEEMFRKIKEEASSVGAGVQKIDPAYVNARLNNTVAQYGQQAIDQGRLNREQGLNTVAVVGGRNVTRRERDEETALMKSPSPQGGFMATPQNTSITPPTQMYGTQRPSGYAQNDFAKQLADAQRQKAMSGLEQAYQRNIGGLQSEQANIDPLYAGQTRQAIAKATMGKKSFSDFLAEKGLASSGLAGQGELSQNIAMQSQLGGIEADRTGALADIERRRTGLGQDLAYGQQQAQAGIDISLLENQMRQQAEDQERAYQEQQQQIGMQSDRESEIKNQFLDTITRFANDYQSQINKVRNDGDTSNDWQIPYLETARQDKISSQKLDQYGRPLTQGNEALIKLAMDKWTKGIPLNQAEMQAIGATTSTKTTTKKSTSTSTKKSTDYNSLLEDY